MLKLISTYNQKVLIFLKKEAGSFTASLFVVSGADSSQPFSRLVSKKTISQKEASHLLTNQASYQAQNIFIIEELANTEPLLVTGKVTIASPYFYSTDLQQFISSLFDTELFLSTQKTRAPTF